MKKKLLSSVAVLMFSCLAFGADNLTANLVEIKTYKGDDGKHNSCKSNTVLVQEIYELTNTSLDGIVIAHATKGGNLYLYQRNWRIKGTNHLEHGYCADPGYKDDVLVRFINAKGDTSNLLKYTVDTGSLTPLEANKFPVLVPVK